MFRRALRGAYLAAGFSAARCCRSSGVEHSLGKGEVECSNHSGSTIPFFWPEITPNTLNGKEVLVFKKPFFLS